MRAAARRTPPVSLRAPFTFRPEGGLPYRIGPENPDFVPLEELPEHVVRAVTTSEDAGFFGHAGFDFTELGIAFAEGLEAGRVVRGGSTITQQLAKNLWLSRDKVLARKVREALGAVALEATVPKARLLEIYLNVAEWGPGVFGIGPAAHHWFGKDARQLSAREAAFLASVIPNPVRYDAMRAQGVLSEAWDQRVSEILLHMASHGVLSDDDLVRALDEPLVFAVDSPSVTPAPAAAGGG
jgi:membrane peptidoglycan carboxypeptidase